MNVSTPRSRLDYSAAKSVARQGTPIIFHHFWDSRHLKVPGAITAEELDDLLAIWGNHGLISPYEWMDEFQKFGRMPKAGCITFDDALLCQYDLALPVLESRGLQAFWFVYSAPLMGEFSSLEIYRHFRTRCYPLFDEFLRDFLDAACELGHGALIDNAKNSFESSNYYKEYSTYSDKERLFRYVRDVAMRQTLYETVMDYLLEKRNFSRASLGSEVWLTEAHVKELHDADHIIGLHSYSHPVRMEHFTYAEQFAEYSRNKTHIEKVTGTVCNVMAHPSNSYNDVTLKVLSELEVVAGFRANDIMPDAGALELPRVDHSELMPALS